MRLQGYVRLVHKDKNGKVIRTREGPNVVSDVGRAWAALACSAIQSAADYPSHIAVGQGTVFPDVTDTELEDEHLGITRDTLGISVSANELNYTGTLTNNTGTPKTVNELGIFDVITNGAGNMFARWLTERFSLANGEDIDVSWTLPFGE